MQHRPYRLLPLAVVPAALALLALGFVLGAGYTGPFAPSAARAEPPAFRVEGSCKRGDVLVFDGASTARCTSPASLLPVPRCDGKRGAFLSSDGSGGLVCVEPSGWEQSAYGLLPKCRAGASLESKGFGEWKCTDPTP